MMTNNKITSPIAIGTNIAQAIGNGAIAKVEVTNIIRPYSHITPLQRPEREEHFVGREDELSCVIQNLVPGNVIAICGPGGIGKTALASEAIWKIVPDESPTELFPDGVIYHNFYQEPNINVAFENIAFAFDEEPLPNAKEAVKRCLSSKKALIFLDGTERTTDLSSIIEIRNLCCVLITSRRRSDARHNRVDLSPFGPEHAVSLLNYWGGNKEKEETDIENLQTQICQSLGGLPLAIRLAGHYLSATEEEIAYYLNWLKTSPLGALDFGKHQHESISVLLNQSFLQLSKVAQSTLRIIGVFAPSPFTAEIIESALKLPETKVRQGLGELVNYGFLKKDNQRYVITHALIHVFTKNYRPRVAEIKRVFAYYEDLEKQGKTKDFSFLESEKAHLVSIQTICLSLGLFDETQKIINVFTELMLNGGFLSDLETLLVNGINASKLSHNVSNEGRNLKNLGSTKVRQGQPEVGRSLYEEALSLAKKVHDKRAECAVIGNIGNTLLVENDTKKALTYYKKALKISRIFLDGEFEETWLCNIGVVLLQMSKHEQAEQYLLDALKIAISHNNIDTKEKAQGNLGEVYQKTGQIEKAFEYFEKACYSAFEIGDKYYEKRWTSSLAELNKSQNRLAKAIELYNQSLIIAKKVDDKDDEIKALMGIINCLLLEGKIEQIDEYKSALLSIAETYENKDRALKSFAKLGDEFKSLGLSQDAEYFYKQAIALAKEIHNEEILRIVTGRIGLILYKNNNADEAIRYIEIGAECTNLFEKSRYLSILGQICQDRLEYNLAMKYFRKAVQYAKMESNKSIYCMVLNEIGYTLLLQGKFKASIRYFEKVYKIAIEAGYLKEQADALFWLGNVYKELNDSEKSKKYHNEVLSFSDQLDESQMEIVQENLLIS
jgi:tetratricopeptide (TPR) repeat protein